MKRIILLLVAVVYLISNSFAQTINIQTLLLLGNKSMQEISEYLMENNWTAGATERYYEVPMEGDYANFPNCIMPNLSMGVKKNLPLYTDNKEAGVFKTTFKKPKEYIILFWYNRGGGDDEAYTQGIVYKTANNSPSENIKYLKSHGYSLADASSGGYLSYRRTDLKEDVVIAQIEKSTWLGYYVDLCDRYRRLVK